jgi:hypothetical protein
MLVVTNGGGLEEVKWCAVRFNEEQQPCTKTSAAAASTNKNAIAALDIFPHNIALKKIL